MIVYVAYIVNRYSGYTLIISQFSTGWLTKNMGMVSFAVELLFGISTVSTAHKEAKK